jgi:hypothetical protein
VSFERAKKKPSEILFAKNSGLLSSLMGLGSLNHGWLSAKTLDYFLRRLSPAKP